MIQFLSEEFSVETLCLLLLVSRSAYYRWKRGASYQPTTRQEDNSKLVKAVFGEHKRRYGSRQIVVELKEKGHRIGRYQVRTVMKAAHLQAIQPKSFVPRTTESTHGKGYCGAARAA
ncbi:IS3 family transposase [Spirosoma luteum]|uniref:IS3 family transposase n=1 Tax=Spirosoma luteum TaxID=431553 RepID=UPI0012FCB614|nr:IS3 family transposase [Spirosoma luteum]